MTRRFNSLLLAALMFGCEQEAELPGVIWEGERIHYATERSEELCGGTLEYLDRRAVAMMSKYGGKPIKYYWLDDITPFCGPNLKGCAFGKPDEPFGEIFAKEALMLHEVAHIRQNNRTFGALEEGIAVHFGDPTPLLGLSPRDQFIAELRSAPVRFGGGYRRAGHFMAFISETYGWETLLELDDALAKGATTNAIDAALRSIVGVGLDEVLAAYSDYPDCLNIVDNSIACEAEPEGEHEYTRVRYERVVDCASPTTLGPNSGWAFVEGIIELPEDIDGTRFVSMTGTARGGAVYLARCGPCSAGGTLFLNQPSVTVTDEDLPAGRYLVRLYAPAKAGAVTVGVSIQ